MDKEEGQNTSDEEDYESGDSVEESGDEEDMSESGEEGEDDLETDENEDDTDESVDDDDDESGDDETGDEDDDESNDDDENDSDAKHKDGEDINDVDDSTANKSTELLEASDSDTEDTERCPICLNKFRDQDVGTPEGCDHVFCLECLLEWSKNVNTCPSDRQVFKLILCKHGVDDIIYKKIPIEDRNRQAEEGEEEELTYCEVCHQCDREDRLLLCDGCDQGFHLDCLTPPLFRVPVNEWFCPGCSRRQATHEAEDADYILTRGSHPRRQVARTMVMERVRSAIEEQRMARMRRIRRRQLPSSDEEEEEAEEAIVDPAVSAVVEDYARAAAAGEITAPVRKPRKTTTKRKSKKRYAYHRKTSTKRKTPRKKTSTTKSYGKSTSGTTKKRTVRRKRKTKRKGKGKKRKTSKRFARTARPVSVTTPKTRIAGALGLTVPPPGRTIPMQKLKTEKSSDLGPSSLSIFGHRDTLMDFDDERDEASTSGFQPAPSTSQTGTSKYSRHALSSYRPIGRVPAVITSQEKQKKRVVTPAASSSGATGGPLDLLGSIMESQDILQLGSKQISINRDGSLTARPTDSANKPTTNKPSQSSITSPQSLFKSSFTVVENNKARQSSVLTSLAESKDKAESSIEEEYDPAHPTDDLDEDGDEVNECNNDSLNKNKTSDNVTEEDEYDPAHPTDDLSSGDEEKNKEDLELPDEQESPKVGSGDSLDVNAEETDNEKSCITNDGDGINSINETESEIKEIDHVKVKDNKIQDIKDIFGNDGDSQEGGDSANRVIDQATESKDLADSEQKDGQKIRAKSEHKEQSAETASAKTDNDSCVKKIAETSQKLKIPEHVSPEKSVKKSPSIKITEPTKKSPSAVKPFGINRKVLFDKKRLYGGEIDFSEDVDFSEGAFPETFELTAKKIEEVFKGTISKKEEEKVVEKTQKIEETKIVEDVVVSNKNKETVGKGKGTTVVGKETKENFIIDRKIKSDDKKTTEDNETIGAKVDTEFKSRKSKEKEQKNSTSGKIKSNEKTEGSSSKKKMSVSDRFKKLKEESEEPDILDEEDPIHKMRELDKELELEFGDSDYKRRKDKDSKRGKRKVSIDSEDIPLEKSRHKKDSRDNRKSETDYKYAYDEKEEGEVDDDVKRERRKKDKKKKKAHDEDKVDDLDTRIVIQVSQNTENRTVWEEDEKIRKKKEKEERRREKERDRDSKKDKKSRRRSRSKSHERRRSRSREKKRSRSRDRSRRKHKDKSRSHSRDRSAERSHKKKRKDRYRSRDRERSRDWSRDRSRERDWSRERDRSIERGRGRERKRSRDISTDRVDIFGRSRSPYAHREFIKDKEIHRSKAQKYNDLDFDASSTKKPKYDEVSSTDSEKMSNDGDKIETVSRIEVKESGVRDSGNYGETEDKDDEYDDEPEETEQFQYTDRDEFLGQNKSKQQRQNLITVTNNEFEGNAARAQPPLPKPMSAPTPPLPPTGDFTQFPPPPPGPPPPGPPPGSVIIQEPPPGVQLQAGGPPGQGILGERPILIQGPPPPLEGGPPPGLIQQRPGLQLLPPGFHRGLPPTISPQRGLIMSPLGQAMPRLQRLTSPGNAPFGWQVTTTADVHPSQFGTRTMSPARFPGPQLMNGPFEGLPPPNSEGLQQFPPLSVAGGEPPPHVITISTNTPPPNVVQIPVDVDEPAQHLGPPPGQEPHLIHLGPDPRAPPPRLPIPLLPPVSDPPPMSVMLSMPPPNTSLMSMPPPGVEPFQRTTTPPNSVSAILGLARMGAGALQVPVSNSSSSLINGGSNNDIKSDAAFNPFGKISELLNSQTKRLGASGKVKFDSNDMDNNINSLGVFKVPLPPGSKLGGSKTEVGTTEVVDMDMGSPINEEGNIELPVSPQFDNLIDNPEDLLEEDFNKKMQKLIEKDSAKDGKAKDKTATPTKIKELKDLESRKDSPKKPKEEKQKHSKENKPDRHSRRHKHRGEHKVDAGKDIKEKALKDAHLDLDSQDVPSSAVDMTNKEKYLKKLHLQERVVEEVKMAIKPFYSSKKITKDQYKLILKKAVPKICHSKSGDINPMKIKTLVEAYVEKYTKKNSDGSDIMSPELKANGERASVKAGR